MNERVWGVFVYTNRSWSVIIDIAFNLVMPNYYKKTTDRNEVKG
jgi:hypothetical protein